MKEEIILSVHNISKTYVDGDNFTQAIKGISFDVMRGEILCLEGESGSGKTTTLNIIGGMDSADEGSVIFNGIDIVCASEKELTKYRRENIGYVFQSYNLMPNLNALQNIEIVAEIATNPMDSYEILKLVGLADKYNKYPSQLSGGQQQRIAIGRAFVKNPQIILADEPTAALDYDTSIEVLEVFEKVVQEGTSVIMVTHNREITKMADRVVHFRDGRIESIIINKNKLQARDLIW